MYFSSFSSSTEGCSLELLRRTNNKPLWEQLELNPEATKMSIQTRLTDPSNVTYNVVKLKIKIHCSVSFTARTDARAPQTGEKFILRSVFRVCTFCLRQSVPFLISRRKIGFKTGGSLINCLNAVGLLCNNTNNYCSRSCHQILVLYTCQKRTQRLIVHNIFTTKVLILCSSCLPHPERTCNSDHFSKCSTKRSLCSLVLNTVSGLLKVRKNGYSSVMSIMELAVCLSRGWTYLLEG